MNKGFRMRSALENAARRHAKAIVPVLKKSRWLLLKREENLKTDRRFGLRHLLRYDLKTVRAYLFKEAFS